ncbi:MAG: hypothetical protein V4733_08930 [Verrucomicrobiota bacterium]
MPRPSRFLLPILGLLCLCAIAFFLIRAEKNPIGKRAETTFLNSIIRPFRKERPPRPSRPLTREETQRAEATGREWTKKFSARFPELHVDWREIPDEQNGYLTLFRFAKQPPHPLPTSEEIQACLAPWNPEKARELLAKHAAVLAEVRRISALPPGSSAPTIPENPTGFVNARPIKQSTDLLRISARLAATENDAITALSETTAAWNLSSILHHVDAGTLLGETVSVLVDLGIQKTIVAEILPALGKEVDLASWRKLIARHPRSATALADVMRGEWNTTTNLLHFSLIQDHLSGNLSDPEPTATAIAYSFAKTIRALREDSRSVAGEKPPTFSGLSPEGNEYALTLTTGLNAWGKGYQRAASIHALRLAALDLLILEKSGTALTAEITGKISPEPATGRPFVFDASTRILSPPAGSDVPEDVEPVKFPW